MKKAICALVASLSLSLPSQAGFLIEPFLGYEMAKFNNAGPEYDQSGVNFGLRLGGSTLGFIYGLEYQKGSLTVEPPSGEADVDTTDMGVFIGFEFPILIRVYGTYYFSHVAEQAGQQDLEGDGGTKIGVSYTGLPFLCINLEMINRSFDERGSSTVDVDTSGYMVGISLPLP